MYWQKITGKFPFFFLQYCSLRKVIKRLLSVDRSPFHKVLVFGKMRYLDHNVISGPRDTSVFARLAKNVKSYQSHVSTT